MGHPRLSVERWFDRFPAICGIAAFGILAVFIAYTPALRAEFIWDDDAHVTPVALRSWTGLWRIWTEVGATQQFYPVLHSAFWFEHRLWGNAPAGYHIVNIALHIAAAGLLALVLRRLPVPGAIIAASIFALHPVHVESVAWISEQKNTLSAIFYLAAALTYVRFHVSRVRSVYFVSFAFFLLGLLTKTVTATLPGALLVVLWWQQGRLSWRRDTAPLVPWLVVGAFAGLFTAWVERNIIGAEGLSFDLTLLQRALLAGHVVWFYLGKLFWPANLTFIYPRWDINPAHVSDWLPSLGIIIVLLILWRVRTHSRSPLAVGLLFIGTLFPVLGFFNVYPFQYSFVADHFQYLASIPVIAGVGGVVARLFSRVSGSSRNLIGEAVVLLLIVLGVLSRAQTHIYRDNLTLFRATIARNPGCWMAYNNLGKELMAAKTTLPEAVALLERAVALRADYAEAHNNLGLALTQLGRPREGIPHLEASLRLKPNIYQTHNNLGIALASSGHPAEAVRAFARAAAINPTLPNIHENWAKALSLLGRKTEADERFAIAARLRHARTP